MNDYFFSSFPSLASVGNVGINRILFRIHLCRCFMKFEGFAELNFLGLGKVAAMSAHCLLVREAAVVLKFSSATASVP